MMDVYLIHHEYDLPDGRVLPVKLTHEGHDRYQRLGELQQQLMRRRGELNLAWHVIRMIVVDMTNAVEEQYA